MSTILCLWATASVFLTLGILIGWKMKPNKYTVKKILIRHDLGLTEENQWLEMKWINTPPSENEEQPKSRINLN